MNRKYLALIAVIMALSIIIAALLFQSFTVNNAANETAKADSMQLKIQGLISNYAGGQSTCWEFPFTYYEGSLNGTDLTFTNYTRVSETAFLGYITNSMGWNEEHGGGSITTITRVANTFYLSSNCIFNYIPSGSNTSRSATWVLDNLAHDNEITVQCTPGLSGINTISNSSMPSPTPSPTPNMNIEQASITNAVFNSNTQVTLTIQNTGSSNVTINTATIDGNTATMNPLTLTVTEGNTGTVTITSATAFTNSAQYTIGLTTAKGNTLVYTTTYSGT